MRFGHWAETQEIALIRPEYPANDLPENLLAVSGLNRWLKYLGRNVGPYEPRNLEPRRPPTHTIYIQRYYPDDLCFDGKNKDSQFLAAAVELPPDANPIV